MKEEILNDLMGYDGLKIIQRPDMFNFSLDSLLLAYLAPITKKTINIIDLCSGNGPVPLYLTLRTKSKIDCVEIQKDVFDLLEKNVSINLLSDKIKCYNESLVNIYKLIGHNKYDLVTCNPPYFKVTSEKSHTNESDYKTIARHEVLVNLEQIIVEAKRLLKHKGHFVLVHKPDRLSEIVSLLSSNRLEPKEIYFIHPRFGEPANHMVIISVKGGQTGLVVHNPIYVYDKENELTDTIKSIYNYKSVVE